jgi:hypothetical protein
MGRLTDDGGVILSACPINLPQSDEVLFGISSLPIVADEFGSQARICRVDSPPAGHVIWPAICIFLLNPITIPV